MHYVLLNDVCYVINRDYITMNMYDKHFHHWLRQNTEQTIDLVDFDF